MRRDIFFAINRKQQLGKEIKDTKSILPILGRVVLLIKIIFLLSGGVLLHVKSILLLMGGVLLHVKIIFPLMGGVLLLVKNILPIMGGVVLLVENGSHDFSTQPQLPSYHPERKKIDFRQKKSENYLENTETNSNFASVTRITIH